MKERIIIEDEDFINKFPYVKQLYLDSDNAELGSIAIMIEQSKKESVPETWEDLKELCKDLKDVDIEEADDLDVARIVIHNADLIYFEDELLMIAGFKRLKIKPARMYQIIKNLIGEE